MSDEFNIKDQHLSFPQGILTRYVSNLAKVIDKFRTIDRSFGSEVLDSGIRYNKFNMAVKEYKFDIFTPTYEVKLSYGLLKLNMYTTMKMGMLLICVLLLHHGIVLIEGSTTEDFKIADDDCINVVTKDEILYLRSTQNENEDNMLSKKIYNMIYSLLNDELSIRKNIRGVDYEDGVYTIRTMINDHDLFYYKHINLLYSRRADSSELYGILERIEEV